MRTTGKNHTHSLLKKPMVSIITVTYNCEKLILRTLQSVSQQTYSHIEHVVIDGLSSDSTYGQIKSHKISAGRTISESDFGIYDAMNKWSYLVSDESAYVLFLNAGDVFCDENVLENIISKRRCISNHYYGDVIKSGKLQKSCETINFFKLSTNMVCHQVILFNTSALGKHLYDTSYKLCSDYKLLLDLLKSGDVFEYINIPIVNYDDSGVSSIQRELLHQEKQKIRREFPSVWVMHSFKRFFKKVVK